MIYSDDVIYLLRRYVAAETDWHKDRYYKCVRMMMKAEEIYQREMKKKNDK